MEISEELNEPGFLTVVFTAYPFSSSILMSTEAMYPLPPVTHAVFFLAPADIADHLLFRLAMRKMRTRPLIIFR